MNDNLSNRFFPLSSRYDEQWVRKNSLGENVLYNLESLCEVLDLKSGMKVLDLGCGKAISAIFLAKEFGVKVWAVDSVMDPTSNMKRINELECEETVMPLKLDARNLPFPGEFFDIILAVDSFMYYGTDFDYTKYIAGFLKPGGQIGIVDICFDTKKSENGNRFINNENANFVHSLQWWKDLWKNSGMIDVKISEVVPESELIKKEYIKDYKHSGKPDILAEELDRDKENNLKIFRMAGERKSSEEFDMSYSKLIYINGAK